MKNSDFPHLIDDTLQVNLKNLMKNSHFNRTPLYKVTKIELFFLLCVALVAFCPFLTIRFTVVEVAATSS